MSETINKTLVNQLKQRAEAVKESVDFILCNEQMQIDEIVQLPVTDSALELLDTQVDALKAQVRMIREHKGLNQ